MVVFLGMERMVGSLLTTELEKWNQEKQTFSESAEALFQMELKMGKKRCGC